MFTLADLATGKAPFHAFDWSVEHEGEKKRIVAVHLYDKSTASHYHAFPNCVRVTVIDAMGNREKCMILRSTPVIHSLDTTRCEREQQRRYAQGVSHGKQGRFDLCGVCPWYDAGFEIGLNQIA